MKNRWHLTWLRPQRLLPSDAAASPAAQAWPCVGEARARPGAAPGSGGREAIAARAARAAAAGVEGAEPEDGGPAAAGLLLPLSVMTALLGRYLPPRLSS